VTALGSVERAEAYVGEGIAVDIGAEGTAEDVEPAHAVTTNSVRKTNPTCRSFLYGPMVKLLLDGCNGGIIRE
jgi:hypothetical protein